MRAVQPPRGAARLPTPHRAFSSSLVFFIAYSTSSYIYFTFLPSMVRHKKDGFTKGKKYSNNTHHRPSPRNEEGEHAYQKPSFKAACWDLEHCDPKRCSGKRLMHFGQMRELSIGQKFSGVVISYVIWAHSHSFANFLKTKC